MPALSGLHVSSACRLRNTAWIQDAAHVDDHCSAEYTTPPLELVVVYFLVVAISVLHGALLTPQEPLKKDPHRGKFVDSTTFASATADSSAASP